MGVFSGKQRRICFCFCFCLFGVLLAVGFGFSVAAPHQCSGHGHDHHHNHDHHRHVDDEDLGLIEKNDQRRPMLLPEEIAEEEDLKMMSAIDDPRHGFDHVHHVHNHHSHVELSGLGLWINAMGCSLLVSLASLICLILLPLIFIQGKPSKGIVDSLALFGAGAMLGDAFLHQLPHAFGGEHSHSHDDHDHHHSDVGQSHSHSLKDLSIGLSILAGIVVFLIVEKLVRYVEAFSGGENSWGHHHHHHHKQTNKSDDDDELSPAEKKGKLSEKISEENESDTATDLDKTSSNDVLRKRNTQSSAPQDEAVNGNVGSINKKEKEPVKSQSSLVFGYLNLFSDGVHNFTDGMALGSAFLLYGSVGGWSRTLFLLAHELPQEIGDFGILVRSGFSVSKALFFNFLSALVALAGTALALMWGKDPGQSSLIEGFTAGGFMYIALAGVLAEMNSGVSTLRNTAIQLISLLLGMAVALCISLVE